MAQDYFYQLLMRFISNGNYNKKDLEHRINVMYAVGQLTDEQYMNLITQLNPPAPEHVDAEPMPTDVPKEQPKEGTPLEKPQA